MFVNKSEVFRVIIKRLGQPAVARLTNVGWLISTGLCAALPNLHLKKIEVSKFNFNQMKYMFIFLKIYSSLSSYRRI
jgi:hypothetical protein